ncbi:MAG TPA: type II secretion system minor pseudopilin GspK [Burkholderiaceae bacterium]|nr:type II secretion system minor pseudopilin GspK [Burkholderiaceae bacterium]
MRLELHRIRAQPAPAARQRGAALLVAMIIVTLIVTLTASMVWQQWRAVQVETIERARAQSAWILSGALDWARLILREDARAGGPDHLGEPWSVPLAEARLSTFLAADKSNADDAPEAFLSGRITDAQARYNLTNLVDGKGQIDPRELARLERLAQTAGIETGVATRIAQGLRDAIATPDANAPLLPRTLTQVAWLGIDASALRALAPYVVMLPTPTPINVNTASREVLAAVIDGLDLASAERLVQLRQRSPFRSVAAFKTQIKSLEPITARLDVHSAFFEVSGRLRLADRVLEERSLVQRVSGGRTEVIERERISSREQAGS